MHICGITASPRGLAHRITFSTRRTGKVILWEQSKRLIAGGLVVLTPAADSLRFKSVIVATVAARPLEYLKLNPPEIDLFFASPAEFEVDPSIEWLMIEDMGGLYEANRHTLLALQRMMREPFPLSDHILNVRTDVLPPKYIIEQPMVNMSSILSGTAGESFDNVNVLENWPEEVESELDESQLAALQRILTKRLAIIQGPPGTGKTHVSVQAVKVMLDSWKHGDPPIIVACQTNHAIDQFLRHVAAFEPDFVRLGGRSKDKDVVKKRTLYRLRLETSENPPAGGLYSKARKVLKDLEKQLPLLLAPLEHNRKPLDHRLLENLKILTEAQADSLDIGASRWVQSKKRNPTEARQPFAVWLGDKLIPVDPKQLNDEHGFDREEADLEQERLREEEAENAAQDDEEFDKLSGPYFPIADNFTCRSVPGVDHKAEYLLKQQDLWKIPESSRPAVYRYLQSEVKEHILPALRALSKKFSVEARKRRTGQFEMNEPVLKKQKIIGMTTTGLSKYRGLLSALKPRVVLIEEAAETLEAPVTVACMPSLQHLVLVGDHKQLRPHTHVNDHEDEPWHLNISLFERMVNNKVEFSILRKQRRMIPEIRRILHSIYGELIEDHPSVNDPALRPNVPGMGGVNSFWLTHSWIESRDDLMSCYNEDEAKMIAGFVEHLTYNAVQSEDITILTFYNGQRKKILQELRSRIVLRERKFTVVTVDSYQGEENTVVILSLTRSNNHGQMGFLSVDNRVCVALSRAQCGFYIFGNAMLLHHTERSYPKKPEKKTVIDSEGVAKKVRSGNVKRRTWTSVMDIMAAKEVKGLEKMKLAHPARFDQFFTVRCNNHGNAVRINEPDQWNDLNGGCNLQCQDRLACGHACPLLCHPMDHEIVNCGKCRGKAIESVDIEFATAVKAPSTGMSKPASRETSSSDSSSWHSFALAEEKQHCRRIEPYVPLSKQPGPSLVDFRATNDSANLSRIDTDIERLSIGPSSASTITPSQVTPIAKKPMYGYDGAADESDSSVSIPIGDGKRRQWKKTYPPVAPQSAHQAYENLFAELDDLNVSPISTQPKEDWSQKGSLLDS